MLFTSHAFLFYFLPLVLVLYYALPWRRNIPLLIASYVFYGWWEPRFLLLMAFNTVVMYVCGRAIGSAPAGSRRRTMAVAGAVVAGLGLLGFFK